MDIESIQQERDAGSGLTALLSTFKPSQTALLVLTGVLGYLIASRGRVEISLLLVCVALLLAVAGTTGLNMFFDRDIDSMMFRTKNRALPAGVVSPPAALFISIGLVVPGVLLAAGINLLCGLAVLSGVVIDLLLYTVLLKRKTVFSVSIGGIAGGMPTLAGYVARSGRIDLLSVSLVLLITLWSMAHIWLIASYYVEDYRRASIPMLPAIVGAEKGVAASIGVILLIDGVVLGMHLTGNCALWAFLCSLALSIPSVYFACGYLRTHRRDDIRRAYVSLSPYLGLMMTLLLLFRL